MAMQRQRRLQMESLRWPGRWSMRNIIARRSQPQVLLRQRPRGLRGKKRDDHEVMGSDTGYSWGQALSEPYSYPCGRQRTSYWGENFVHNAQIFLSVNDCYLNLCPLNLHLFFYFSLLSSWHFKTRVDSRFNSTSLESLGILEFESKRPVQSRSHQSEVPHCINRQPSEEGSTMGRKVTLYAFLPTSLQAVFLYRYQFSLRKFRGCLWPRASNQQGNLWERRPS